MSEEEKVNQKIESLENQVKLLIKELGSQALLLKAQNNKLNNLFKLLEKEKIEDKHTVKPKITMVAPEKQKQKKLEPVVKVQEEIQPVVLKEEAPIKQTNLEEEKCTISQRVLNKNNKAMYMVAVQITEINSDTIVARPLTKGNGIWVAKLSPGKYKLKYTQQINLNSDKLEKTADIIVQESKRMEDFILS